MSRNTQSTLVVLVAAVLMFVAAGGSSPLKVDGLHVVLIAEQTGEQSPALQWADVHLRDHAPAGAWCIVDPDSETEHAEAWVQEALALPRDSLPWLVVADGRRGFTGPLPSDADAIAKLLEDFQ